MWFSGKAATPGLYAAGPLQGGQANAIVRLMTGNTDITAASDAAAIVWDWQGQEFTEPDADHYKQVNQVVIVGSIEEPVPAVTVAIRANGNTADNISRSITLPAMPGQSGKGAWRPGLLADLVSFSLHLSGSSETADEITAILIHADQQGMVL
jgi:hypothetical protein